MSILLLDYVVICEKDYNFLILTHVLLQRLRALVCSNPSKRAKISALMTKPSPASFEC